MQEDELKLSRSSDKRGLKGNEPFCLVSQVFQKLQVVVHLTGCADGPAAPQVHGWRVWVLR